MKDSSNRRPKAIIVGAGIGGTATAARLAHAGLDVEVYEKNDFSGGRCSLIHHDGYRFDQGPSLLLLPPLFHQLYNDLGTTLESHIDLIQCRPNYIIHYHDGTSVTLSSDRAQLAAEVSKWEGPDGAIQLEKFLEEASIHGKLSYQLVLSKQFPHLWSLLRPSFIWNVVRLHPFGSLWGRCSRYFKTERIRRAFSFGSMYLGSSPFDSPGTYTLLQWTETCEGIWYPIGGFHRVPASLVNIAESHSAKFHYSSPVRTVTYDPTTNKATGVILENGERKEADVVVVNADLVWAYNNLFTNEGASQNGQGLADVEKSKEGQKEDQESKGIGKGDGVSQPELVSPGMAKKLLDKPHSCSSISFYWAMDRKIDSLNTHNIFLAEEYKASFDDIFKRKGMPREPSFYVNVPSRIDPTAAPPDKDALVILIPVGHLLPSSSSTKGGKGGEGKSESIRTFSNGSNIPDVDSQDWNTLVERARNQVIESMESRLGFKGLREMIVWEGVNTPETWKDKFNLTHGSILGITHDFFNVLSFRHQSRHPKITSAYFVGASAHPGTGVPIAIAGSRLCTESILGDLGMKIPKTYTPGDASVNTSNLDTSNSELNRRTKKSLLHILEDIIWQGTPYFIGALLMALVGLSRMYYTGRFVVSSQPITLKDIITVVGNSTVFLVGTGFALFCLYQAFKD